MVNSAELPLAPLADIIGCTKAWAWLPKASHNSKFAEHTYCCNGIEMPFLTLQWWMFAIGFAATRADFLLTTVRPSNSIEACTDA
jgi:hypothetical protein